MEVINPNAVIAPVAPEETEQLSDEAITAKLINDGTINPFLPRDELNPPAEPTMDIVYGSPFGTPRGNNPHRQPGTENTPSVENSPHQELNDLASQSAPQDDSPDLKTKLVGILKELQNQQEFLQVIAQENPQLYENINYLVQMIIQMARNNGLSKAERRSPAEEMAQSLRDMHPSHDCKSGDCYHATEALYHLLGGREAGYEPQSSNSHWFLKGPTGKILDPTGGDVKAGSPKKLVTTAPSSKAMGLIDAVIRRGPLKKRGLPAFDPPGDTSRKIPRVHLQLPIGSQKGIKIKVLHRNGHSGWRQVQAGMVQGLEPDVPLLTANSHPVSVKRPYDE